MKQFGKYEKQPKGKGLLQMYLTSLLCLVLCVSMFLGTTYAWFTSEATSTANEIHIGVLDVGLFKMENGQEVDLNGSSHKLFDSDIRWEPGYTALETIQIKNEGDLSFRYALTFTNAMLNDQPVTDDGAKAQLKQVAENFVVYVHPGAYGEGEAVPSSFADIQESDLWRPVRMGKDPATLADILEKGFPVLSGNQEEENEVDTYILALHMVKTAGEGGTEEESIRLSQALMGQKISLNVKLTAYQRSHETDAFNKDYDLQAHVTDLGALDIAYSTWIGQPTKNMTLDTAYQFQPVESYEEVQSEANKKYIADFVVWADEDVPANSIALAGYYDAWCRYNEDRWIVLQADTDVPAGEQIRLVESMGEGFAVTYEMLCEYGNDGIGFLCGAKDLTGENAGTTITVELRLYEVVNGAETDNYIVAGRYEYTFPQQGTNP